MKRKSTLILIAALVLAVIIPAFAMAVGGARNADSTWAMGGRNLGQLNADGTSLPGSQFSVGDYLVDEDGFCYALDENGEAQRLYARGANGQYMYLQFADGKYCWSDEYLNQNTYQTRTDASFGRGCPRWN